MSCLPDLEFGHGITVQLVPGAGKMWCKGFVRDKASNCAHTVDVNGTGIRIQAFESNKPTHYLLDHSNFNN